MATGRKAFEGESQASLIASILTGQPPPDFVDAPAIDAAARLVRARPRRRAMPREESGRAVADGARRQAGARWIGRGPALNAGAPSGPAQRSAAREALAWAVGGRCDRRGRIARAPSVAQSQAARRPRFVVVGAAGTTIGIAESRTRIAISPDGRRLAMVAARRRNDADLGALARFGHDRTGAGHRGRVSPFWSPDSRFSGSSRRVTGS